MNRRTPPAIAVRIGLHSVTADCERRQLDRGRVCISLEVPMFRNRRDESLQSASRIIGINAQHAFIAIAGIRTRLFKKLSSGTKR